MNINAIVILFIVFVGLFFSSRDNQKNRGVFIILISLILLMVAALRSPEWFSERYGLDTMEYKLDFESYLNNDLRGIWSILSQGFHGTDDSFDVGFIVLKIFIGRLTQSFYVYSILIDLIFFIPLGIILYRYSTSIHHLVFAYVFYISLIQVFLLSGARQIVAIGFDMMALLAVIDRKRWKAVIFFLLGISVHFSSFLFLIPLLMVWFDLKAHSLKLIHIFCFVLFPVVFLTPNSVISLMSSASGSARYANYGTNEIAGGATTFIFMIESLSLLCLFAIKESDLRHNKSMRFFYVMAPLFTIFAPLVRGSGVMIRLSLYFHLFLMLLVPFSIDCLFHGRLKVIVTYCAIAGLAFLTLKGGGIDYYFFWQL